ncbi:MULTISPECIES: hypothetical protein [unclassified Ruminococcus]|uniref:hypothetical protein n=1 Tax=unclassified Ruminococcus TaxID=2608920 RepID=UPI00210E444A|nr:MULTISPECIES: hypothetical protein [unclassified Ruminococcus]MCQ4022031.1 hypothetical protein [Ruminococcus sp. zg-924]MCQ4114567.1 hypothetical protein [Ruminococcus sp. zg-921]
MNPFNQAYGGYAQTSSSPSAHLCEFLKKPIIFVIGLFSSTSALLVLIGGIIISSIIGTLFDSLKNYAYMSDPNERIGFNFIGSFLQTYIIALVVISVALTLLGAIPYIIMYFRSRGGKKPTGAVTILQVVSIINLIGACFATLSVFMNLTLLTSFSSMFSDISRYSSVPDTAQAAADIASVTMIIYSIVMAVYVGLNLAYTINKVRLAFSAKGILKDRESKLKGISFVGVMNVITAIFEVISTISVIFITIMIICNPDIASATANYHGTSVNIQTDIISSLIAVLIVFCVASALECVTTISKAIASFGAKRHMSTLPPMQTPTNYYNDGYSNFDNNSFNPYQNGFQSPNSTGQYGNPYSSPYGGAETSYGNPYTNDNGGGSC